MYVFRRSNLLPITMLKSVPREHHEEAVALQRGLSNQNSILGTFESTWVV